jgi:hypothetical protein
MIDPECAICFSLTNAASELATIVRHIDWSCMNKKKKEDFGLTKSFVNEQIKTIQTMQKWHQYHHSTGGSSTLATQVKKYV